MASVIKSFQALVGTHCVLTVYSIARAGIGIGKGLQNHDDNKQGEGKDECFDAKHYDLVTDFISRIYCGRGIKKSDLQDFSNNIVNSNDMGVRLSPTVSFEDPAAVCVNAEEVQEAFRALRSLNPVELSSPKCINVAPLGSTINLTFLLNQQYTLPYSRPLILRSLLIVTVQLQQKQDIPESEFIVTSMKELWWGNPLIQPYLLFYIPRRLNGIISYYLTSRLL
mmetsp:Transcript_20206/g.23128  ORF Transcript_20206/g.23128 Transcript_20206/m.23128 type:complete len:224 (+) Transcript_20206:2376-3047(+)